MIRLVVNGREQQFEAPPTVAALLESLGVRPDGVAVAVAQTLAGDREPIRVGRHRGNHERGAPRSR